MFLYIGGNCQGLALMRSITAFATYRKRRPNPGTSFSYQLCASINSALAVRVKIAGCTRDNPAQARPSMFPK